MCVWWWVLEGKTTATTRSVNEGCVVVVAHLRSAHTAHGSTVRHSHVAHSTRDAPRVTTHNRMATTKGGREAEGRSGSGENRRVVRIGEWRGCVPV